MAPVFADQLIGQTFAERYEILEPIGFGGWAQVYKAKHVNLNRIVAIKLLNTSLISDLQSIKRFEQEAKTVSLLTHKNIVAIHDYGLVPQPYIVMDYLEGESIDELVRQKPLSFQAAQPMLLQICDALQFAHDHGLVHRDLKPANIMLAREGLNEPIIKVLDFGLVKFFSNVEGSRSGITKVGETTGSPHYMSPEQCYGQVVDARSDIYSLGCLMHEMLTGERLFKAESILELMNKHISEPPPLILERHPDKQIPPLVQEILATALAKAPADRYQSMSELKQDLQAITEADPEKAFADNRKRRQLKRTLSHTASNRKLQIAICSLVLAAVGVFYYVSYGEQKPKVPVRRSEPPQLSTDAYITNAQEQINKGEYRIALSFLNKSLATNPDNVLALVTHAEGSMHLGNFKVAKEDCDRAIELEPGYAAAYVMRAYQAYLSGHPSEVINDCNTALRLEPLNSLAHALRAGANNDLGHSKEALIDCNKAIALAPKVGYYYVIRAKIFNKLGRYKEAVQSCVTSLQDIPPLAIELAAQETCAEAYDKLGDHKQAQEYHSRAGKFKEVLDDQKKLVEER